MNRVEFSGTGALAGSMVTLDGVNPSTIVANNCHENWAGSVPKCPVTPVSCPP